MNPFRLIRRSLKRLLIWARLGSTLTEYCLVCGRRQPLVWHAPDPLWMEIIGRKDGDVLCPVCFDQRAIEKGILLFWTCDEDRAFEALLVSAMRSESDPEHLPELTDKERAVLDSLGPDFVERLLATPQQGDK